VEKISFKSLVDRHSAPVFNAALRILGNPNNAHDVHQEVFLAVLRRWHKFDAKTKWPAYLYRATVRKAMEYVKRSRREVPLSSLNDRAVVKENPDGPMRTGELQHELLRRLSKLPKRQADVFVLSRIEGLDNRRVAEIVGCSPEAARVHLCQAAKRLSSELRTFLEK